MAHFCQCPACSRPLLLPDDLDMAARLNCPLCGAGFWPSEALAGAVVATPVAVSSPPPAAPPIATPPPAPEPPEPVAATPPVPEVAVAAADAAPVTPPPVIADPMAAEPPDVPPPLGPTDLPPGEPVVPEEAGAGGIDASLLFGPGATGTGEGGQEPLAPIVRPYRPMQQRPDSSGLRNLMGLVAGGLLGPCMAYYLLNFFGGPQFNFLEIRLPGVPHTYQKPVEPPPPEPRLSQPPTAFPDLQRLNAQREKRQAAEPGTEPGGEPKAEPEAGRKAEPKASATEQP